ncbi:TatD family hydrolase [Marinobacter orientalis]|uniref:TatD family hydrolase n=1 Tax=Marinobacter orientalis TaxID=1928859 RepID=A0A7Y0RD10_9GAMM|nr:TatD family hydrolase [Marinobacter orientalis]NMT63989.1 TatD family hydrolase [Marinobacter orientalis]TGX49226.1 TatD family deoxyribonuclease [Marinobacter orientalis]
MRLIDAHCHFDFPEFDGRREAVLEEARSVGLSNLVIPGVRRSDWGRVSRVATEHEGLYYCLGIHPWYVAEHNDDDLSALLAALVDHPGHCVALGECGLDRLKGDLKDQYPWFEAQVDIATQTHFPLVIHSVKTHDEVYEVLRRKRFRGRVLVHGFSGSYQQASKLIDLGCFIGVGGVITHPRARKTRDTISRLPVDALVLETDAPDMAPEGVPQGDNSPACLALIFNALAELRNAGREDLAHSLLGNVQRLYGWNEIGASER